MSNGVTIHALTKKHQLYCTNIVYGMIFQQPVIMVNNSCNNVLYLPTSLNIKEVIQVSNITFLNH